MYANIEGVSAAIFVENETNESGVTILFTAHFLWTVSTSCIVEKLVTIIVQKDIFIYVCTYLCILLYRCRCRCCRCYRCYRWMMCLINLVFLVNVRWKTSRQVSSIANRHKLFNCY
ncbi:hypothetical protein EDC94DRAFT_16566 [Helicostylum pulchrum]|nr:hypothetical protein EDC94DRAFT_16566 [Helicostylum pulchrum]